MKTILLTFTGFLMALQVFAHEDHKHKESKKMNTDRAVKVEIGKKGFKPETALNFKPNENIVLNITRTTDKTCMKDLKHPRTGRLVKLPMNKEVRFEIGKYKSPQEIKLLCGMGMKAGVVHIKEKN